MAKSISSCIYLKVFKNKPLMKNTKVVIKNLFVKQKFDKYIQLK